MFGAANSVYNCCIMDYIWKLHCFKPVMLQVFMNCWSLNVLFLNPCISSFNANFIESILASSVQPFLLVVGVL